MSFFPKTPALITYVMAGDPDLDASERALDACLEGGADAIRAGLHSERVRLRL